MSDDTCVRASPCSRAASGIDVSWLSESRASLRCCFAAAASTFTSFAGVWSGAGFVSTCAGAVAGGVVCAEAVSGSARSAAAAAAVVHRAVEYRIAGILLRDMLFIAFDEGQSKRGTAPTSSGFCRRVGGPAGDRSRSYYLLEAVDVASAWVPAGGLEARQFGEIAGDEVRGGIEAACIGAL